MSERMNPVQELKQDYPWVEHPLVVGAPMRLISLAEMAVDVSKAHGIGFIGTGTDISTLPQNLSHAQELLEQCNPPLSTSSSTLPIGIGFINWGCPLEPSLSLIAQYRPCAVWFFAPSSPSSLEAWVHGTRTASPATKIWIQVGSVREAVDATTRTQPDVLVVQGTADSGGHGLVRGASLITLAPEVCAALDAIPSRRPVVLAAGGLTTARSAAASFLLGASGVVLGTRLLATPQACIHPGYKASLLSATDGGQTTVRTKLYDFLRGTTGWPDTHNARAITNQSFVDATKGMSDVRNKELYEQVLARVEAEQQQQDQGQKEDEAWGEKGRLTMYAGTGIGLITEIKDAGDVVREIRDGVREILQGAALLVDTAEKRKL
ncbi:inosine monophosphate dehydrogenase [Curvularia clavata]|uniref:Inosine monophosphate dehydrogenase n=1 Tax=Curvularia clavata TaxID=95742 RepID=A0A9Q9DPM2_CURCL|nr:inosine monophosphate dehydrogenase [Curvularia clavata]